MRLCNSFLFSIHCQQWPEDIKAALIWQCCNAPRAKKMQLKTLQLSAKIFTWRSVPRRPCLIHNKVPILKGVVVKVVLLFLFLFFVNVPLNCVFQHFYYTFNPPDLTLLYMFCISLYLWKHQNCISSSSTSIIIC